MWNSYIFQNKENSEEYNTMNEMISVIVPVFAVEKYIDKCIKSIQKQTYTNLEIILVDDGSPDNCPQICDLYKCADDRIHVVHRKNGGLSAARNSGLEIARGKYISFIDSDDYIYPDMYEKMILAMSETSADLCVCGIEPVYEENFRGKLENIYIEKNVYDREEFLYLINKWYYVTTVNKLYKRELFEELRFPEGRIHEDEFMIHYVVEKCSKIVTIPDVGYVYVQRANSIMNAKISTKHLDLIYALIDRYYFFQRTKRKKLAHQTAIYAYGYMMHYLEQMDIGSCPDEIKKSIEVTEKVLINDNNSRAVKLFFRYLKAIIKKDVTKKSLEKLKRVYTERSIRKKIMKLRSKLNSPIIVFICTPIHGNLGDQAIVFAQYRFFKSIGLEDCILEITDPDYYRIKKILPQLLNNEDIIVIDGGGNIGSLWPREDEIIREVICTYVHNKIFIFPQTSFYSNDSVGIELKNKMRTALNIADNVTFFCRDITTYDTVTSNFNVKSYFVPDIVMSLHDIDVKSSKKIGVLVCLREDRESSVQDDGKKELLHFLKEHSIPFYYSSTVKNIICRGNKKREKILFSNWREFAKADLIITDRLHGMIFSAILGIPCIAFDNKSHKVINGYYWLSELPYINISRDKNEAIELFKGFYKNGRTYSYLNRKAEKEFQRMKENVENEIR